MAFFKNRIRQFQNKFFVILVKINALSGFSGGSVSVSARGGCAQGA
nr:MAG TPA: hypothetical protein [Caudoviricetes sp.]